MGKRLIENDRDLTRQLTSFFARLSSACKHSTPVGNYLAQAAKVLSEQENTFFASLPVSYYGHLETPCVNNLPYHIDVNKLIEQILNRVGECRKAIAYNDTASDFTPSEYVSWILNPDWPASTYATSYEEGVIWIGKRHPYKIAQESLRLAAHCNSNDKLFDKALHALEDYITIDTSIFEIYKRVAQCYENNWGESGIDAPCELAVLAKMFDPYATGANPELDYRYREKLITPELIANIAILL